MIKKLRPREVQQLTAKACKHWWPLTFWLFKESVQLADPYLRAHAALAELAVWALLCRRQS